MTNNVNLNFKLGRIFFTSLKRKHLPFIPPLFVDFPFSPFQHVELICNRNWVKFCLMENNYFFSFKQKNYPFFHTLLHITWTSPKPSWWVKVSQNKEFSMKSTNAWETGELNLKFKIIVITRIWKLLDYLN